MLLFSKTKELETQILSNYMLSQKSLFKMSNLSFFKKINFTLGIKKDKNMLLNNIASLVSELTSITGVYPQVTKLTKQENYVTYFLSNTKSYNFLDIYIYLVIPYSQKIGVKNKINSLTLFPSVTSQEILQFCDIKRVDPNNIVLPKCFVSVQLKTSTHNFNTKDLLIVKNFINL